jgi:hypothetical protein
VVRVWKTIPAAERGAAGEGEVEVEARDEVRGEVVAVAAGQGRERDGRVDVVERERAAGGGGDPLASGDALGDEGPEDDGVGLADVAGEAALEVGGGAVEGGAGLGRAAQVAVVGVPGAVAFEEEHVVAAGAQGPHEPAVVGGVTVSPRRR